MSLALFLLVNGNSIRKNFMFFLFIFRLKNAHFDEKNMNRYETLKTLGDGTYGSVYLAKHMDDGVLVAIKRYCESLTTYEA